MILDPFDPQVAAAALAGGVPEATIDAARRSPVYRFVKEWGMALPLHAEFRTLPMLFYVPPLLPAISESAGATSDFFTSLETARLPMRYMASLFGAGNEEVVKAAYRRLIAVRVHRRAAQVGDLSPTAVQQALGAAELDAAAADEIYRLTSLASMQERVVIPPMSREAQTEPTCEPQVQYGSGFGFLRAPSSR
jgi:nitrate reductase beta subunit